MEKTINTKDIKNIIVVQIGKIGDMVLTIPLFYYLKQICPDARLTVLASSKNDEIPKNLSYVDETITFSKNILSSFFLLKSLRKRDYDILIDVNYNYSRTSERILKTLRPKHSFGMNLRKELYETDLNKISKGTHLSDITLSPVLFLKPEIRTDLAIPLRDQFPVTSGSKEFSGNKFKILFNISAGSKSRYWSKENWCTLIKDILKKYGNEKYSYYITGITANEEDIDWVRKNTNQEAISFIKTYNLAHLFQVISNINLLISPDTSLVHVASLYNKPVLGLYPNVNWNLEKFKPLSELSEVVISNNHENIFDINEKEVFEKYCNLIEQI